MDTDKSTCTIFTPYPTVYGTQLQQQIDSITLPMKINAKILGVTLDPKLTYNKHIEITTNKITQDDTDTQSTHINNMGDTKGNDQRTMQSHNKTHTRVRFHHNGHQQHQTQTSTNYR